MKLHKVIEINEYFKHDLYEMSNYFSKDTGLSDGIKLWVRTEPTGLPHTKYRIKIEHPQKGSAVFALWGDDIQQVAGDWNVSGKDLKRIQTLISLTQTSIIQLINGEISTLDLGDTFRTVKDKVRN